MSEGPGIGSRGEEAQKYFDALRIKLAHAYDIANQARKLGLDPSLQVEIKQASDVAARVEGIVGPIGITEVIRALEREGHSRQTIAHMVVQKIAGGEIIKGSKQRLIEQAVRTGVGILTEGVLVAPTEGISRFEIKSNQDGSDYLAIYFAGPIRSAGGTVAALAVVLGDVARRQLGVGDFRPTDALIERYVEEIDVYGTRSAHLQYRPPDPDIRHIVKNCPVCIDGDPTEDAEVAVHRDVPGVATNRVRSGIALVICEGIAQKAAKVSKYTKKIKLDWGWMDSIIKVAKKEGKFEPKPDFRFLDESVAGRAIFSYPSAKGGWRLRYGRSRGSGIMGKSVHPASMVVLDSFIAVGTQLKIERPGKSTVITPCDSILGPIVKLKDGSVVDVPDAAAAEKLSPSVERILFLGDMLFSVGDFFKSNHPLFPAAWCEERFELMAKKAGHSPPKQGLPAGEAVAFSRKTGLPLHPAYTYFWHDISHEQLRALALWLKTGKPHYGLLRLEWLELESAPAKSVLEELCVLHSVHEGKIRIGGEHAYALLKTMGIMVDKKITGEKFEQLFDDKLPVLELLSKLSGMKIMPKAPTYIGSRMGRPEKARERKMKKSVNVLFPIGNRVDKNASISRAYAKLKAKSEREGKGVEVEIVRMRCAMCGNTTFSPLCACGGRATVQRVCPKCGRQKSGEECTECRIATKHYDRRSIDLMKLYERAAERAGIEISKSEDVKGVEGLFSETKTPEPLEKGFLRAENRVFVFRDGTCRFDATDIPLTHFKPAEIGLSAEQARSFCYLHDKDGKPLENETQVVALHPQDIILSRSGAHYLFSVSKFIDSMLERLYNLPRFYNLQREEDLLGHLVIGLSPHTSAGVLARVIGFTDAHVGFAHPYFHTAKRRNADGDEDTVILLMDGLLNFSRAFLPESRGGTMDAPLVLTTELDPDEVDDEAHSMEVCSVYPIELYELSDRYASPSELQLDTVKKLLGKPEQYGSLAYSHETSNISLGPHQSTYLRFKDMGEKIEAQFTLQEKIRAVNPADAAERLLLHHFFPDLYGNLRSFSQQEFRCLDCKVKYRRIPLSGKCNACGGKLLLTISKGGITKYLDHADRLIERYHLPVYMKQRMELFRKDIASIFTEEPEKQKGLADFM
jgi:DNA polymerase II large subunit